MEQRQLICEGIKATNPSQLTGERYPFGEDPALISTAIREQQIIKVDLNDEEGWSPSSTPIPVTCLIIS
jgi:hypothetical protein